jgi:hypothetical protein
MYINFSCFKVYYAPSSVLKEYGERSRVTKPDMFLLSSPNMISASGAGVI